MDDRFIINRYSAASLIVVGLGQILTGFLDSYLGLGISILGLFGFIIFSRPSIYLIISLIIWGIGIQITILHWPFGRLIILLGEILTLMSLYLRFKKDNFKNYKLWILISILILFLSYYLKLQHNDLNLYIFIIGSIGLIISYGLRFAKKKPKFIDDYLKLIFIYSILILYLFRVEHYPGQFTLSLIVILSTLSLGGFAILKDLKIINYGQHSV
jgi:hypothetical protein